ncbi:MAG TPA: PSD1 and planctomycete cytochrome C domain-containing protein, partial [Pirellulales bacterium]|nr:PSD1 and planctomycete cytochrome C domain-containing protein [Pirellulales bacterium]
MATVLPLVDLVGARLNSAARGAEGTEQHLKFFETKIRPLLASKCTECHGAETQESSLRLDSYAGMLKGGKLGPAVVPGNIDESLIISAVGYKDENLQMPPDGRLAEADIEQLRTWILMGAPHPDGNPSAAVTLRPEPIDFGEARKFWAFQPIKRPDVPLLEDGDRTLHPIDALLLSSLRARGLTPNPAAGKRTLIRRATFDLTGLPPTPEEIADFLADESPAAFEKVIDRLLGSSQYGERWGRHWLDVARYADSNGQDENQAFVDAWRYRNYVIDAFNADEPFDRFLLEQVAGDLLEKEEVPGEHARDYGPWIATGFLALGPKVLAEKDETKMEMDIVDEQIDTFGQAFLGLTLACARCHDHKFDPISTADYYALAGIFKSTKSMQSLKTIAKYNERILATEEEIKQKAAIDERIKTKQQELDALVNAAKQELSKVTDAATDSSPPQDPEQKYPEETRNRLSRLRDEIKQLAAQAPELPTAMGVQEGTAADARIHVRGSHLTLGRRVKRGVPAVLQSGGPLEIGEAESGRLQLAKWLVSPGNPLTARVAVNRIWRWHFGQGLVASTDNFGRLGERPSHPELLDWLAAEFIESGWSIKALHKQIMLSSAYQHSSDSAAQNTSLDPENSACWRANVQRLDAESIRDSLLTVSGLLDRSRGQSALNLSKWQLVFDHTSKDDTSYDTLRRSVYLPVIRNNLYDGFALFDYTTADVTIGSRETSTVAPQALFVMNSELFASAAEALARRLFQDVSAVDRERVVRLYEIALGREPKDHEIRRLLDFIS